MEAKRLSNVAGARIVFDALVKNGYGGLYLVWYEYSQLERIHGDNDTARKVRRCRGWLCDISPVLLI